MSPSKTALVTGASTGIGRAFAVELAARGYNVVVVARDVVKLEALAQELKGSNGGDAEVLPADLTDPDQLRVVEERVADTSRPIDLLVNNAGFATMGRFVASEIDREIEEISLNVIALVRLSRASLAPMVERGSGGLINVASLAAFQPNPLNATYGATKAYVNNFSQAVHEELKGTGVKCMVLCPGFTRTEFQVNANIDSGDVPDFLWQSAEEVVAIALRAYDRGRAVCVPGALNTGVAAFTGLMPSGVTRRVAAMVIRRAEK